MGRDLDTSPYVHTPDWAVEVARPRPAQAGIDVPLFGGGRALRLARRRRIVRMCSAVLALVVVSGAAFVISQRNRTGTVTLDEAVQRFRAETADRSDGTSEEDRESLAAAIPDHGQVPGVVKAARAPAEAPTAQKVEKAGPYELPLEGVYGYRATGGEQLSIFGAKHEYPERVFATVRHLGGCRWEHRNEVIEEHTDIRTFCSEPSTFTQLAHERQVEFFGKRDGAAMRCRPALDVHRTADKTGQTRRTRCTDGKDMHSEAVARLVGTEVMKVGGEKVRAVHVRIDATMSGRAEGTSTDDLWLAPDTGLTLRWDRTVDTVANAFGGAKARYREDASFLIESLDPQA